MSQVAHGVRVAFDSERHLCFQSLELRIGKVERHADQWRSVGTPPLIAEIDGGTKAQSALCQFVVEPSNQLLDPGSADREAQVADPPAKQLAPLGLPLFIAVHTAESGKPCTLNRKKKSRHVCAPASLHNTTTTVGLSGRLGISLVRVRW